MRLSDRILVMREGFLVAEFQRKGASQEAVITAALGRHAPETVDAQAHDVKQ
jgi:ABC-type sugar transport system ATPase subunit